MWLCAAWLVSVEVSISNSIAVSGFHNLLTRVFTKASHSALHRAIVLTLPQICSVVSDKVSPGSASVSAYVGLADWLLGDNGNAFERNIFNYSSILVEKALA